MISNPVKNAFVDKTCFRMEGHNFHQSLDQLIHSTTQLANTLVSNVVESSPQLYVKTKLHLLSCIGIPSSGEVATKLERIDALQENSRISMDRRGICRVSS